MNPPEHVPVRHPPMRAGPEFDAAMEKVWHSGRVCKITFTGGEPMLYARDLISMLETCHRLGFETSVTSNGTLLTAEWLARAQPHLSFMGFSIDTLDDDLNKMHGRYAENGLGSRQAAHALEMICECARLGIPYKINTVITRLACERGDLSLAQRISSGLPGNFLRWKIIRCTAPPTARLGADNFRPSDDQWSRFKTSVLELVSTTIIPHDEEDCGAPSAVQYYHQQFSSLGKEENIIADKIFFEDRADTMQSYLLMTSDWKLEILGEGQLRYTRSIIGDDSADFDSAIAESGFDSSQAAMFRNITTSATKPDEANINIIGDATSASPSTTRDIEDYYPPSSGLLCAQRNPRATCSPATSGGIIIHSNGC